MSAWSLSNFFAKKFYSQGAYGSAARLWVARACRAALPQQCAFCLAPCGNLLVCVACCAALQRIDSACPLCALPAPGAAACGAPCGACLARPPPFAAAFSAFAYAFPLDRLLHAFKYGGRLSHAEFFAAALCATVAQRPAGTPWPDALVALPLAPSRQRERGFDQSAEIARRVARLTGLKMLAGLRRTRDTPAQASLPWKARAGNVRDAFAADPVFAGQRIAIVDDVMTTGATLASAAYALLRAGARGVEAWAVARTLPPAQP
jgi:ComF family protein